MCYGVIACAECGEWLDEFSASTHRCKVIPVEAKREEISQPILVSVPSKGNKRSANY